jgi:hypothetical protein
MTYTSKNETYETSMVLRITKVDVYMPHASSMVMKSRIKLTKGYN